MCIRDRFIGASKGSLDKLYSVDDERKAKVEKKRLGKKMQEKAEFQREAPFEGIRAVDSADAAEIDANASKSGIVLIDLSSTGDSILDETILLEQKEERVGDDYEKEDDNAEQEEDNDDTEKEVVAGPGRGRERKTIESFSSPEEYYASLSEEEKQDLLSDD